MAISSMKSKAISSKLLNGNLPSGIPPVTGYSLWLDGADAASFTYSSGTVVSQWNDRSGNGRNFTQPTTANQPTRNVTQNSKSGLTFQGSWMYNTSFNWSNSANTVFMVVKYDTATVNYSSLLASGASTAGYATAISSDDYYAIFSTSIAPYTYNLLPTSSNADVAVWKTAGVSGGAVTTSFWRNGTAASSTRSITGLNAGTGAILGASTTGGGDVSPPGSAAEFIFEVLVYPSQLSDTDRNAVEAYLKAKWGTP